ncbi:hypothetical protein [Demequina mangrovi]|uniref:Uncharacterized protein n=1 Tax=Demequina mangrovi TaxID=1043493 RepID=A0A1H6U5P6_9MICO|nr:hypothetical protein [Demequina mangrovi]SEI84917.1 hypothetical protein SAMN05421637_0181 [Demequina mangrovi]
MFTVDSTVLGSFEPGFYLMLALLAGSAIASITVAIQNRRGRR